MPVIEYVAFYGKTVCEIHGEHSRRNPAVHCPGVHLVISVRIPDRRKMRSVIVGAVFVLEFKSIVGSAFEQLPVLRYDLS